MKTDIFYLGVISSTSFNDLFLCKKTLDKVISKLLDKHQQIVLVTGGTAGINSIFKKYAKDSKIKLIEFIDNLTTGNRSAEFICDNAITEKADLLIAFWNSQNDGTLHTIKQMNIKSLRHIKGVRDFQENDIKCLNKVILIRA